MYYFKATVKTLKIKEIPKKSANNGGGSDTNPTNTGTINNHEYIATFSYCETFKGLDKKTYGIALEHDKKQNLINTIKLDEDREFTSNNKDIFNFLCSMKDEKLVIGFDNDENVTKSQSKENEEKCVKEKGAEAENGVKVFEVKEVSLEND